MKILEKIFGSPVKCLGFICICYGLLVAYIGLTYAESAFPRALYFLGWGSLLYMLDAWFRKRGWPVMLHLLAQCACIVVFIMTCFLLFSYGERQTTFSFPDSGREDAIIIYGIEGYPELPAGILWKRTIHIPESRILITSSKKEDLPDYAQGRMGHIVSKDGRPLALNVTGLSVPCITNLQTLTADYFSSCSYMPLLEYLPSSQAGQEARRIAGLLCEGKLKSRYVIDTEPHMTD